MFVPALQETFPTWLPLVCVSSFALVGLLAIITSAIRIVPEYARMVVFRFGRLTGTVGPGLVFLLPLIDRGIQVDLREKKETISCEATTQDNARLTVQLSLNYHILEPEKTIMNVPNLSQAVREMAQTSLKSILGGMTYGDVLHDRAGIEQALRSRLEKVLQTWGSELTSVEIVEVARG